MKITNEQTIKSIIDPEDRPSVAQTEKTNLQRGVGNVKSTFETAPLQNSLSNMIDGLEAQDSLAGKVRESLQENQAETLQSRPSLDQVLHWLSRIK